MFFQVFDQLILATQFLIIFEVIHSLVRQQSPLVKLGNELFLTPYHVPFIRLHALPSPSHEGLKDAISKIGTEVDSWTECGTFYMREWFSFLMSLRKYSAMVSYQRCSIIIMNESIATHRLNRLSLNGCLLGQPDLIIIRQTKVSTNFFKQEKRIEDVQENYINGLIFPTTAHFSSFISTRYKAKDPSKLTVKARLLMFDAYGEKDIHIEINIPGSMEVKSYNLRGEQLTFEKQDYERAYFSSFLRSLYPMNYPNIILYPLLSRLELLKSIVKNFIPFSYKHQLRELGFEFDLYRSQTTKEWEQNSHNLSIEILIDFCIQNQFSNLLQIVMEQLKRHSLPKYYETEMKMKMMNKKYGDIICKTAEKLLLHGHANKLKEHQIQALYPLKKYPEIAYIGKSLLESGGTNKEISTYILISLMQTGQDVRFLKSLNLVSNLHNSSEKSIRSVAYKDSNKTVFQLQNYANKSRSISQYPQFCFPFDNHFYNRLIQYKNQQNLLKKNAKDGFTMGILQNIQASLINNPPFYDLLVRYEKQKGWKTLMKYRTDSFWLQTDFQGVQENFKISSNKQFDDNYSFFQQKFEETSEIVQNQEEPQPQKQENNSPRQNSSQQVQKVQNNEKSQRQSFDGNLSQHQQQKQAFQMPKCSARVNNTLRPVLQKKSISKILCGVSLEKLFVQLYNDIKLQNSLQTWQNKLRQIDSATFSAAKRELAAMIYLKKGFLHRKMQRNKKCEQSFKMARKLSLSYSINLVAIYQLLLLYIDNRNTKGVEFYLIELIKLFKNLGVQNYDIVPEWAKPIIQYVLTHQGLSIVKNIHPVFKAVFGIFLRANYTEQQVEALLQSKKEK